MEILVTRHGQTDWNLLNKVQGKVDIELNAMGRSQAKVTAEKLKDEAIDLIICSPLKRAMQTAKIINENRDIPIIYDERISERDFGEFQGLTRENCDGSALWDYDKNYKFEKAECVRDFFDRVYNFLDEIKIKYQDKRVLVVCHGGVSIPIQSYFNGIPENGKLPYGIDNCEVVKFTY